MSMIYVAACEGEQLDALVIKALPTWSWLDDCPQPSADPADGQPIIEHYKLQVWPIYSDDGTFAYWLASAGLSREAWAAPGVVCRGDTALQAACRCIVANMIGEVIEGQA